jgi:large subunit ribosomal protein L10
MRVERVQLAEYATDMVRDAAYLYLVSYQGLSVEQIQAFRGTMRDSGASCRVLKNSYIKLGLKQNQIATPSGFSLSGDTAVVYGQGDPVTVAKALREFSQKQDKVQMKGGVLAKNFLSKADAEAMADMPSIEQIHAQIVFAIKSPAQRIHRNIRGNMDRLVHLLQSYIHQKESE